MRGNYNAYGAAETSAYALVPIGKYLVKVKKVITTDQAGQPLVTKNGDPTCRCQLVICDGPHNGSIIFHQVVFFKDKNSKGHGMTKHFLKVLGEQYDQAADTFDYDTVRWVDLNEFIVEVKHEDYKGKIQAKVANVDYVNPQTDETVNEMGNVII